jgi:hypothetical protein
MKIRHTGNSPKSGIEEHVLATTGNVLVAAGLAEEIKMPKRGAPGWLEARMALSGPNVVSFGENPTTEWSVYQYLGGPVFVTKDSGAGRIFFTIDNIPNDCPQDVADEFRTAHALRAQLDKNAEAALHATSGNRH